MCMRTYFHYTDRDGLQGILKSGRIRMSPNGRFGEGVYLTQLPPSRGREKISLNNWGGMGAEMSGKVDYAISVRLPDHKVEIHGDIFLFTEDVHIDQTSYSVFSKYGDHEQL